MAAADAEKAAKEQELAEKAVAEMVAANQEATVDEVPSLLAAVATAEQVPCFGRRREQNSSRQRRQRQRRQGQRRRKRPKRQQRRLQQQQRRQRLSKTAETAEEEKAVATAVPSPPSLPTATPPFLAPPSPAQLSAAEAAAAAAEAAAAAAVRLVGEEERNLAEAEERLREAAEAAVAMQAATVGATVGDGGGGVANDEAASPSAPACNEGGNQSHVANDEAASMIKSLAEERVTTAIDVAALQQREERRGARAHPRAPRRPSAAVREGAATHAPRRGRRGGSRGGTAPCLRLRPHVASKGRGSSDRDREAPTHPARGA